MLPNSLHRGSSVNSTSSVIPLSRLGLIVSALVFSACSHTQPSPSHSKIAVVGSKQLSRLELKNTLQGILAILQVDMGIDGHLRSLPAIQLYIKEKLQKHGIGNPDVHVEMDYSTINEDGLFPFLSIVIGAGDSKIATSARLGTHDIESNTWLRTQVCKNFLTSLVPELEKIVSLSEENNIDEDICEELLSLFFTKHQTDFRNHGMLLIGCALALDDETEEYSILIRYINPLTGEKETAKMPLKTKKKTQSRSSLI